MICRDATTISEEFMLPPPGPGQWYSEREVFLRVPAEEEAFAEGEVILWTIAPYTLRDRFSPRRGAVQLLFNFGILVAQKLAAKAPAAVA